MSNTIKFILRSQFIALSFFVFQTSFAQKPSFGPQLGANIANVQGTGLKSGFNFGYHIGAFAKLPVGGTFAAQMEVLWSQIQSKKANNFNDLDNVSLSEFRDPRLDYLSIPVSVLYKLKKVISIQGGVQYSILINSSNTPLDNGKQAIKQGDMSALLGVQAQVLNVRAYARYLMGLSNIAAAELNQNWRTSVIQVGVGVAIF
jgi:hypothetical protein